MKNNLSLVKTNLFTNNIRKLSNNYRPIFFRKNNTNQINDLISYISLGGFFITTPLSIYLCRENKDLRKYPLAGSMVITVYNGVYWLIFLNFWPVFVPIKMALAIDYFIIKNN